MFWVIFILSLFSVVDSFSIGKIENHIMIGTINDSLFNINIDQCICEMMKSNELISALNYFQTNETCQLFFYNIDLIFIEFYLNATLMFINQSSISIRAIQSTQPTTSSSSTTTTKTSSSSSSTTTISSSSSSTTSSSSSSSTTKTSSSSSSTTTSSSSSSSTTTKTSSSSSSTTTTTAMTTAITTTVLSTTAIRTTVTASPLPSQCSQYTLITDGTRNANYPGGEVCDQTGPLASAGWYRISGSAGIMLASSVVPINQCDTLATGWYSGVYPSAAGTTNSGTVCYNWDGNTCWKSNLISVTNCNGYYVFYLPPPPGCSLRYCTV